MGTTKTENFSKTTMQMSDLLRALGNPARFEIISLIRFEKECLSYKISEKISLSQSTISKHISELKNVNLITTQSSKNGISYAINQEVWQKIENYFNPRYLEKIEVLDDFEIKIEKKDTAKISKKNPNLKNNNYQFSHLILKSKNI